MEKRDTRNLLLLLTKLEKQNAANGENGLTDEATSTRKRNGSQPQTNAGAKKRRNDDGTQWINSVLEPKARYLTGIPNKIFQTQCLHHNILQTPLQPGVLREETLLSHFEINAPWTVRLPVPLCATPVAGPPLPDIMVRSLLAKETYRRKLLSAHVAYKRIESNRSWPGVDLRTGAEDGGAENSAAVVYAALLDRDPDPYLIPEVHYDYHFTGGSIATVAVSDAGSDTVATVFKAVGEGLEEVEVTQLVRTEGELTTLAPALCLTGIAGPVLEITADGGGRCVLVRKRHVIVVLREVTSARREDDCSDSTPTSGADTEWRAVQYVYSLSIVPFASVCILGASSASLQCTLTICTTDYRRRLCLWRIERKNEVEPQCEQTLPQIKRESSGITRSAKDNWSAVRCVDGLSLLACVDRARIHLYSAREGASAGRGSDESSRDQEADATAPELVYRGCSDFRKWTLPCEQPCALEVCQAEGLMFIATSHKLLVANVERSVSHPNRRENLAPESDQNCDAASDESSSSCSAENAPLTVSVLLVFTHNLRQAPVFLSHQRQMGAEGDGSQGGEQHFLLFGSHLPMSYGVCCFTKSSTEGDAAADRTRYQARHLPMHPRTFHDAYRLARTRGFCLSANEPLRRRFYACQSGLALVPAGKGGGGGVLHILVQSSGGDLLQQAIVPTGVAGATEQAEEQEHVVETLRRWHEQLVEQSGKLPYKATNFRTLKKFRDIFNCTHALDKLKEQVYCPLNGNEKVNRARREARRRQVLLQTGTRPNRRSEVPSSSESSDSAWDTDSAEGSVSEKPPKTHRTYFEEYWFRRRPRVPPWRQTVEEIQQYKDVLAPAMLAVWGYGGASSGAAPSPYARAVPPEPIPTKLPPYEDVHEKIGSWVNSVCDEQAVNEDDEEEEEDAPCPPKLKQETPQWDTTVNEDEEPQWWQQEQQQQRRHTKPNGDPNGERSAVQALLGDSRSAFFSQESGATFAASTEPPPVERKPPPSAKKKYVKGF